MAIIHRNENYLVAPGSHKCCGSPYYNLMIKKHLKILKEEMESFSQEYKARTSKELLDYQNLYNCYASKNKISDFFDMQELENNLVNLPKKKKYKVLVEIELYESDVLKEEDRTGFIRSEARDIREWKKSTVVED